MDLHPFRTAYLRIANALARGGGTPSFDLLEFLGDKNRFCG
jgi:hypothetical protein